MKVHYLLRLLVLILRDSFKAFLKCAEHNILKINRSTDSVRELTVSIRLLDFFFFFRNKIAPGFRGCRVGK